METRVHITASTGTLYVLTFVAVLCLQQPSIRDIEAPPERINLLRKVCGQTPLANDRIPEEKKMRRRGEEAGCLLPGHVESWVRYRASEYILPKPTRTVCPESRLSSVSASAQQSICRELFHPRGRIVVGGQRRPGRRPGSGCY